MKKQFSGNEAEAMLKKFFDDAGLILVGLALGTACTK